MPKTLITKEQELEIVKDYTENKLSIYPICEKYKIGKLKLKAILSKYEVELNHKGKQPLNIDFKVKDFKIKKYVNSDATIHIAYDENTDFESKDIDNAGGVLTTYINKQYGIEIPTLYDRRMYYMTTGNYWWEQWLKVKEVQKKPTKKCPYCDWETEDVENNSGAFEVHLRNHHNMSKEDYIKEHPEDKSYFLYTSHLLNARLFNENPDELIECKICGKKFISITQTHLESHNITREEYVSKYGMKDLVSKTYHDKLSEIAKEANKNMTFHRVSTSEKEIIEFVESLGFKTVQDRTILNGQELDIYIPEKKLAIEYDGLYWHNEIYKDKNYHLSKTNICKEKGIQLVHIFEDEWLYKQEIIKSRLRNILGVTETKIFARKCEVREVSSYESNCFLSENHLQGKVYSKHCYGLYCDNELVSIMTFGPLRKNLNGKSKENEYELLRFCNKLNTTVVGGASKLLKYFIDKVKPTEIITYADKRWSNGKLYENLNFKYEHDSEPSYFYVIKNKRINRFTLRKNVLVEKYGCPKDMSEHDFCLSQRWYRIYDCGTMKFSYHL